MLEELLDFIFEDDGELQEQLLEAWLEEGQLDDSLLHLSLEVELTLLQLSDELLKLRLSPLLEQHGAFKDDEGQLQEELEDKKLSE